MQLRFFILSNSISETARLTLDRSFATLQCLLS